MVVKGSSQERTTRWFDNMERMEPRASGILRYRIGPVAGVPMMERGRFFSGLLPCVLAIVFGSSCYARTSFALGTTTINVVEIATNLVVHGIWPWVPTFGSGSRRRAVRCAGWIPTTALSNRSAPCRMFTSGILQLVCPAWPFTLTSPLSPMIFTWSACGTGERSVLRVDPHKTITDRPR